MFKLYHNEQDIEELAKELEKKGLSLEKEQRKKDKIEDEVKEKKKESGKIARELNNIDQQIKESVSYSPNLHYTIRSSLKSLETVLSLTPECTAC